MDESKRMWVGVVVLVIVAAFALWWLAASQPISTWIGSFGAKSTTTSTNTIVKTDRPSSSVVSIAENISGASTFGSWLASTGVAAEISGKGPYTIFVPTDSAVAALKAGTFSSLSTAGKKRFVEYHVVAGRAIDVDAENSGTIAALSKDALNFSNTNNVPMVNSGIIIGEYRGSNGTVYVINAALIPPLKVQ